MSVTTANPNRFSRVSSAARVLRHPVDAPPETPHPPADLLYFTDIEQRCVELAKPGDVHHVC